MRRFFIIGVLAALFAALVPASAQDQRVLDRVDQVMEHLSQQLGQRVTRQTHFWSWQERIFQDAALGCPSEGQTYPDTPNRAFQVIVVVDDVEYDYRVTGNGELLVLCGADGLPVFRSDEVDMLLAPTGEVAPLPPSDWYAWIYGGGNDLLYLVNPDGLQATVQRPTLANEAEGQQQMVISRDGSYLVQAIPLQDDRSALLVYDFLTGNMTRILANPGQEIRVGEGGSSAFDADSEAVAVTFLEMDSSGSEWTLALLDLATVSPIAQITRGEVVANLTGGDSMLTDALNNINGVFFPAPVYIDNTGVVHFRMILAFAGGAMAYPAAAWNPATNAVNPSPYVYSSEGIHLSSGEIVYTTEDPALPAIQPAGPYPPNNTVIRGTPVGDSFTEQVIYTNGDFAHLGARWALGTELIAFNAIDATGADRWQVYQPGSPSPAFDLPVNVFRVQGFGAGLLTVSGTTSVGFDVVHYRTLTERETIWQGPANAGFSQIIWALPDGVSFGLDEIALTSLVTVGSVPPDTGPLEPDTISPLPEPPPGDGIIHCDGSPPSIIGLNIRARVTIIDGSTLNTRTQPGTSHPIVRILPEGEEFNVINGPACSDGFTWWQLRLEDGTFAWAAEGDDERYFMEPAS